MFNVSITTVQNLENISLKVREELITGTLYQDARPPGTHHYINPVHFG
jgi:hypothetical protein